VQELVDAVQRAAESGVIQDGNQYSFVGKLLWHDFILWFGV
jgi:hypothetical protein